MLRMLPLTLHRRVEEGQGLMAQTLRFWRMHYTVAVKTPEGEAGYQ